MQISIGSVEMVTPASTRDSLPAAPAGYGSGYLVYHPGAVLNVVAAVVFIIMLPLLSVMTLGLHGGLSLPIEVPLDIIAIAAIFAASGATLLSDGKDPRQTGRIEFCCYTCAPHRPDRTARHVR